MRIAVSADRMGRLVRAALFVAAMALVASAWSVDSSAHLGLAGVTWTGTVSRLLDRHCVECHSEGGARPRLDDYDSARAAVQAIKHATLTHRMPVWHAVSGVGDFANDPSLTPYEIGLLAEWADEGAPRGNALAQPVRVERAIVPPPDLLLQVSSKHAIRNAVDTFELPTGLTETRWIRGWTFQPGNRSLVQSAVISLASGATLGTWVAGESVTYLPEGVARQLAAGSTIVLTINYRRADGPAVDASALGLYFGPRPYAELGQMALPCGTTRLTQSIESIAIRPAIGAAGASLRVVARRPNQTVEPLGWFQDYASDDPETYRYRNPVALPRGSSIEVASAHGDCSAELEYVVPEAGMTHLVSSHGAAAHAGAFHDAVSRDGAQDHDARRQQASIDAQTLAASDEGASGYVCPMHPDVRNERPGNCPVCQMTLLPSGPHLEGSYALDARVSRGSRPDEQTLRLVVRDPAAHGVVRTFEKVHERPFHLFLVSDDLEQFAHVHPTAQPDGSLTFSPIPASLKSYRVFADFLPAGGTPQLIQKSIVTGLDSDITAARATYLAPDLHAKTDQGLRVAIDIETGALTAGASTLIDFVLSDAATGEPVSNLEPYLGAWGHMFIVSADLADAVHSHPLTLMTGPGGPKIVFNQRFPKPGSYRLWVQFQRGGQLSTVPFTVAVN